MAWSSSSGLSARIVPSAPAELRGLRITGYPISSTKARTSSGVEAPVDCAQGIPASRRASFIAGLSRQNAVRTLVPGMPQASRIRAVGITWASTVASRRSTHSRSWQRRTVASMAPSSQTEGTLS